MGKLEAQIFGWVVVIEYDNRIVLERKVRLVMNGSASRNQQMSREQLQSGGRSAEEHWHQKMWLFRQEKLEESP